MNEMMPPATLYHYTSQAGLIGILSSKHIWASKIHYLNDSREFSLALDIARAELGRRIKLEKSKNEQTRLGVLLDEIDTIFKINICVVSFSELGDSLSQWRGYCGRGPGYSIGFETTELLQHACAENFSLSRCVYDDDEQLELVSELVDDVMATDFNTCPGYVDPERPRTVVALKMGGDFAERLAALAPLIKDHSFSDEKEWRLVSRPISSVRLDHRPGESMIVPYYRLAIGTKDHFDSIQHVIVGPTPHPELSEASVITLLVACNASGRPKVKRTLVPFRNW